MIQASDYSFHGLHFSFQKTFLHGFTKIDMYSFIRLLTNQCNYVSDISPLLFYATNSARAGKYIGLIAYFIQWLAEHLTHDRFKTISSKLII